MTQEEQMYKDAVAFLNCQVKAQKLCRMKFNSISEIKVINLIHDIQIYHLIRWCEILNMPYNRESWSGNATCGSDWDIVYFDYKGYRFFELVEKGKNE